MGESSNNMLRFAPFPKFPGRWLLPSAALVAAIAMLTMALLSRHWCADALLSESVSQKVTLVLIDQAAAAKAPSCEPEFAYAQLRPPSVSLDKLVQTLQDSANAFGVTVLSVGGEPHPANDRTLESLAVSIALHGSYAGIKSTLAESLSRFPSAILQQMSVKRAGAAQLGVEDANVQVVFVLRPKATAPNDCRMPPVDIDVEKTR